MLTRMRVRNFKKLSDVEIELGRSVVFIGPNNSGKTAALQALALWDVGVGDLQQRVEDLQAVGMMAVGLLADGDGGAAGEDGVGQQAEGLAGEALVQLLLISSDSFLILRCSAIHDRTSPTIACGT